MRTVWTKIAAFAAIICAANTGAVDSAFDSETGLRIHHYTDPVPADVPGGVTLDTAGVVQLLEQHPETVLLDVISINDARYDALDGSWPDAPRRENIPGSLWLPNVGFGRPADDMFTYLIDNATAAVSGDLSKPVLVYCIADCWMGWNAVQHLANAGFDTVYWYPEGTDGWVAAGRPVEVSQPVPVSVE
jgi:PQQ-dependent catabolism-associated CXXCW motif protein